MDTGLPSGLVTGRFTRSHTPGRAGQPIAGLRIMIEPDVPVVIFHTAGIAVYSTPTECTTNAAGTLVIDGWADGDPTGVELVATDAPGADPAGWRYCVAVSGPATPRRTWNFKVPADQTTDLTTALMVAERVDTHALSSA